MSDSKAALDAHNDARRSAPGVKRPDLTWDDALVNDAKKYAQYLADNKKFEHSGVQGQGENLYMSSGNATLTDAFRAWLNEKPNYHGENIPDGDFGKYGHYTQCIWPTTTKLGIAAAKASNGATYIVARYTPPGNWMGQNAYGTKTKTAIKAAAAEEAPAEPEEGYSVVDGESLEHISQKLDTSLDAVKARNPNVEGPEFVVHKGDTLTIPYKDSQTQFGVEVQ